MWRALQSDERGALTRGVRPGAQLYMATWTTVGLFLIPILILIVFNIIYLNKIYNIKKIAFLLFLTTFPILLSREFDFPLRGEPRTWVRKAKRR